MPPLDTNCLSNDSSSIRFNVILGIGMYNKRFSMKDFVEMKINTTFATLSKGEAFWEMWRLWGVDPSESLKHLEMMAR